jgi:hypothetical protein
VLVVAEPHKRYVLAVKQPGGKPPIVLGNEVYGSAADAEWAVFKRRWEAAAGQPLAIE